MEASVAEQTFGLRGARTRMIKKLLIFFACKALLTFVYSGDGRDALA